MIPDWSIRTQADRAAIDQGCYWDQQQADAIVNFTEKLFRSQFIPGKIKLRTSQKRFLQQLYGWRLPDGRRRFRYVNLHVPKKSWGKTLIVCIICLYELAASGEPSPFVVSAAASRDNASQVFNELRFAILNSPFKRHSKIKAHTKEVFIPKLNATYKSLASDGNRVHGINASVVVIDEAHVVPADLYQALRYAGDARPNAVCILISTAGDDVTHWYYKVYQKSKRILSGEDLDITHYAEVYEADEGADYLNDESQWTKANPHLGAPEFPVDQFHRDLLAARSAGIGEWLNFLRLKLNIWCRPDEAAWFDLLTFDQHHQELADVDLADSPCAIGADLSEVGDPSSVAAIWETSPGNYYVRCWCWVAAECVKQREATNLPKYREFIEENSMVMTPGNQIDDKAILSHILDLCNNNNVQVINFDPRGAYVMGSRIIEEGYQAERVPQNFKYFSGPMKEFRKAFEDGRIKHNNNQWLKYCLSNVRIEGNRYDEIRPYRKRSIDHIDGAVATMLAFMGLLTRADKTVTTPIVML